MRRILFFFSFILFAFQGYALTLTEAINLSLENSDKIKQARAGIDAADYTRQSLRAAFMPKADLSYTYTSAELSNVPNPLTAKEEDATNEEANLSLSL
ncbi:MAG: TolC family protein, partial [Treponema sp.]|nr:TolC family protein [Treponema sp.]